MDVSLQLEWSAPYMSPVGTLSQNKLFENVKTNATKNVTKKCDGRTNGQTLDKKKSNP